MMAPNFELCCLSLPQFYRKSHDTFYILTQDSSYVFRQVLLILEWHLQIFDFESQETNRTKILRKLWRARLQIGVECVKGYKGTFTYPPAFFLPVVFLTFQPKLYCIFNCDFWIWPLCTFTYWISQTPENGTFWCMQWHQQVIAELRALFFINFH